jgi:hypothetical protein
MKNFVSGRYLKPDEVTMKDGIIFVLFIACSLIL